jgi:heptosyltransferase-1
MQALLKSAWLVRMSQGVKHGLDFRSAREPLASLFYDVRHRVEFWQPAVTRQRELAAATFGYTYEGAPDFGLQVFEDIAALVRETQAPYAVIMPSASRDDKLWPVEDWHGVFDALTQRGLELKLLAGNPAETARAQALIAGRDNATVLPRLGLQDIAPVLAAAQVMVGLDSGLTHLSAALGRPTIGIYKASTPVRTPLVGAGYTARLVFNLWLNKRTPCCLEFSRPSFGRGWLGAAIRRGVFGRYFAQSALAPTHCVGMVRRQSGYTQSVWARRAHHKA